MVSWLSDAACPACEARAAALRGGHRRGGRLYVARPRPRREHRRPPLQV